MTDDRTDGPGMWFRARAVLVAALRERDRMWTWVSLIVFGVWSIVGGGTPSLTAVPLHAQTASYAGFVLAGVLGLGGAWLDRWAFYVLGHVLAAIGLLSAAGVILLRSGSPVAVLLFGFATVLAYNLQLRIRERRVLERVIASRPDGDR